MWTGRPGQQVFESEVMSSGRCRLARNLPKWKKRRWKQSHVEHETFESRRLREGRRLRRLLRERQQFDLLDEDDVYGRLS